MAKSNVMDSSASSNALMQDNCEGLIEKNDIHMQKKNYRVGTQKKNKRLNTWNDMGSRL